MNSTTSKRTPPPGANRRTLGIKPLYKATGPSSLIIVTNLKKRHVLRQGKKELLREFDIYAGYVQLYFGTTPGTFVAPWIRDLTTSNLHKNGEHPSRGLAHTTKSDHVRGIQNCADKSSSRSRQQIVPHLGSLILLVPTAISAAHVVEWGKRKLTIGLGNRALT